MGEVKTNKQKEVMVAGHICLDIFPSFDHNREYQLKNIFSPGKLTKVNKPLFTTGGLVGNTGMALHRLGVDVGLVGRTGFDLFAEELDKILTGAGLDTSGLKKSTFDSTSYSIMFAIPGIDKIAFHSNGVNNNFCLEDIDFHKFPGTKHIHLGYPNLIMNFFTRNGEEMSKILKAAKANGISTSIDTAPLDVTSEAGKVDWVRIFENILPDTDIIFTGLEELVGMLNRDFYLLLTEKYPEEDFLDIYDFSSLQKLGERVCEMGADMVIIKCGKKGVYLRTKSKTNHTKKERWLIHKDHSWFQREIFHPGFHQEKIESTTGAGDCFNAGFLTALLRNKNLNESLTLASACGAMAIANKDNTAGLGSWQEVLSYSTQTPVKHISWAGNYWRYDSDLGVWLGKYDKYFNLNTNRDD